MQIVDRLFLKRLMLAGTKSLAIAFLLMTSVTQPARAQTYKVIHNFAGPQDGEHPYSGLTNDTTGNLYGTTNGEVGSGTVFELTHTNTGWVVTLLEQFQTRTGEAFPLAGVVFEPDGSLYGTTSHSGGSVTAGTVFALGPVCANPECVLYQFKLGKDGAEPNYGSLLFDSGGNIYGATIVGGSEGQGAVYQVTPFEGGWREAILYSFSGADGARPFSGLTMDSSGRLYGTTTLGGSYDLGTAYQLTFTGSGWSERVLWDFQGMIDGELPTSSLIFDQSGNLYGSTCGYGPSGGGTVFELTPSGDTWILSTLYSFPGSDCPWATLTMDQDGNLYGTTVNGGNTKGVCYPGGCGTVYELTFSNNGWTYSNIHSFNGSDGQHPYGHMILVKGHLYGTTANGGTGGSCLSGCGVVFEINP